jgi:hypothetical protein
VVIQVREKQVGQVAGEAVAYNDSDGRHVGQVQRAVLAVADLQAQHLAVPVRGHPGRHDHGLGHDPVIDAGLAVVASRNMYRNACPARLRSRNAATSVSRSAQIRDTSDLEIPLSAPSALTRSSTLRVEVPCR